MVGFINNKNIRTKIRAIAVLLVITFFAQDITWAYPDRISLTTSQNNKLAPPDFFGESESRERANTAYEQLLEVKKPLPVSEGNKELDNTGSHLIFNRVQLISGLLVFLAIILTDYPVNVIFIVIIGCAMAAILSLPQIKAYIDNKSAGNNGGGIGGIGTNDEKMISSRIGRRSFLASLAAVILSGCSMIGEKFDAETDATGPVSPALKKVIEAPADVNIKSDLYGYAFGFEGFTSHNMRDYLVWLKSNRLVNMSYLMPVDNEENALTIARTFKDSRKNDIFVIFSYSCGDSFVGIGGKNGFIDKLDKINIPVDALIMFDNNWPPYRIPKGVRYVIHVRQKGLLGGKEIAIEDLENKQTIKIDMRVKGIGHLGFPLPSSHAEENELLASNEYTSLIIRVLDFIYKEKVATNGKEISAEKKADSPPTLSMRDMLEREYPGQILVTESAMDQVRNSAVVLALSSKILSEPQENNGTESVEDSNIDQLMPLFEAKYWNWDEVYKAVPDYYNKERYMTRSEEVALGKLKDNGNGAAFVAFVEKNVNLVRSTIRGFKDSEIYDDLVSEGYYGLGRAASRFRWQPGYRFSTYACNVIQRAVGRFIKKREKQERLRHKDAAGGDEELSGNSRLEYLAAENGANQVSFDGPVSFKDMVVSIFGDRRKLDIELLARIVYLFKFDDSVVKFIMDSVENLPNYSGPRDKEIILRHMAGYSFREIKDKVGGSRERMRQIEERILGELPEEQFLDKLREFCLDRAQNIAIEGTTEISTGALVYSMRVNNDKEFDVEYIPDGKPVFTDKEYEELLKEKPALSPDEIIGRVISEKNLRNMFRRLRVELRLRNVDVAQATGLSQNRISTFEAEKSKIPNLEKSETMRRLLEFYASKLGMKVDGLFKRLDINKATRDELLNTLKSDEDLKVVTPVSAVSRIEQKEYIVQRRKEVLAAIKEWEELDDPPRGIQTFVEKKLGVTGGKISKYKNTDPVLREAFDSARAALKARTAVKVPDPGQAKSKLKERYLLRREKVLVAIAEWEKLDAPPRGIRLFVAEKLGVAGYVISRYKNADPVLREAFNKAIAALKARTAVKVPDPGKAKSKLKERYLLRREKVLAAIKEWEGLDAPPRAIQVFVAEKLGVTSYTITKYKNADPVLREAFDSVKVLLGSRTIAKVLAAIKEWEELDVPPRAIEGFVAEKLGVTYNVVLRYKKIDPQIREAFDNAAAVINAKTVVRVLAAIEEWKKTGTPSKGIQVFVAEKLGVTDDIVSRYKKADPQIREAFDNARLTPRMNSAYPLWRVQKFPVIAPVSKLDKIIQSVMDRKNFHSKIKGLREEIGLNVSEVAGYTGLPQDAIEDIESGALSQHISTLLDFYAAILKKDSDELSRELLSEGKKRRVTRFYGVRRPPRGSSSECVKAIIKFLEGDLNKQFNAGALLKAGLRTIEEWIDLSDTTVKQELQDLYKCGILELSIGKRRSYNYNLCRVIQTMPLDKAIAVLEAIADIPSLKTAFVPTEEIPVAKSRVEEIIRNADKVLAEARGKAAVKTGGDLSVAEEEVIFNEEYWNWDEVYEIVKKSKFYKKKYSLTKDETLALFALRDKGNGAAWKTLIHFNTGLVYSMVGKALKKKYAVKKSNGGEKAQFNTPAIEDELISESNLALMRAAAGKWDPEKGEFSTYASNAIDYAIKKVLRSYYKKEKNRILPDNPAVSENDFLTSMATGNGAVSHQGTEDKKFLDIVNRIFRGLAERDKNTGKETIVWDVEKLAGMLYLFKFDRTIYNFFIQELNELHPVSSKNITESSPTSIEFSPRDKNVFLNLLEGSTLDTAGKKVEVSLERARQIRNRILATLNKNSFTNDFKDLCTERAEDIIVEGMIKSRDSLIYSFRRGSDTFDELYEHSGRPVFTEEERKTLFNKKPLPPIDIIMSRVMRSRVFYNRLARIRAQIRLHVKDAAEETKLSLGEIRDIENGKTANLESSIALYKLLDLYASKLGIDGIVLLSDLASGVKVKFFPALEASYLKWRGTEKVNKPGANDPTGFLDLETAATHSAITKEQIKGIVGLLIQHMHPPYEGNMDTESAKVNRECAMEVIDEILSMDRPLVSSAASDSDLLDIYKDVLDAAGPMVAKLKGSPFADHYKKDLLACFTMVMERSERFRNFVSAYSRLKNPEKRIFGEEIMAFYNKFPRVWENPNHKNEWPILSRRIEEFKDRYHDDGTIRVTDLVLLESLSQIVGKSVYLKDESTQTTGSFKIRGVIAEVDKAIRDRIEAINNDVTGKLKDEPFFTTTQTRGNHGESMIRATRVLIEKYRRLYPALTKALNNIEPVVYTTNDIPAVKLNGMLKELADYRKCVGDDNDKKGGVFNNYKDYADAEKARKKFNTEKGANAVYMEHGGIDIMAGHASAGIEIARQLKELGIKSDKKVALIVPVGEGGPVGVGAGLKLEWKNVTFILVQTEPYNAFIRSLISKSIEKNLPNPEPTMIIKEKPVVFEDGIAVTKPQKDAVEAALAVADAGVVVDPKLNLLRAAPILSADLRNVPGRDRAVVGGTTSATAEALLEYYDSLAAIKDADIVVLFGTEGNVDPDITEYIENLAGKKGHLIGNYLPLEKVQFEYYGPWSKYVAKFRALNIVTEKEEIIELYAQRAPPGLFNGFRKTNILDVDIKLEGFIADYRGGLFLLEPNRYGINGIGTSDTLAIAEPLEENKIALFHELAHAANLEVEPYIEGGSAALDDYIKQEGKEYRNKPEMRGHYALRLFQSQRWGGEDRALSDLIKFGEEAYRYGMLVASSRTQLIEDERIKAFKYDCENNKILNIPDVSLVKMPKGNENINVYDTKEGELIYIEDMEQGERVATNAISTCIGFGFTGYTMSGRSIHGIGHLTTSSAADRLEVFKKQTMAIAEKIPGDLRQFKIGLYYNMGEAPYLSLIDKVNSLKNMLKEKFPFAEIIDDSHKVEGDDLNLGGILVSPDMWGSFGGARSHSHWHLWPGADSGMKNASEGHKKSAPVEARPVKGSLARFLTGMIKFYGEDLNKESSMSDFVKAGLMTMADGYTYIADAYVENIIRFFRRIGILETVPHSRPPRYRLSSDIRNLSPPAEKSIAILNAMVDMFSSETSKVSSATTPLFARKVREIIRNISQTLVETHQVYPPPVTSKPIFEGTYYNLEEVRAVAPDYDSKGRLLKPDELEAVCILKDKGNKAAWEVLVEKNLGLVNSVLGKIQYDRHIVVQLGVRGQGKLRKIIQIPEISQDLTSAGYNALMKAAARYRWRRGFRFATYAYPSIRRAMYRVLNARADEDARRKFPPDSSSDEDGGASYDELLSGLAPQSRLNPGLFYRQASLQETVKQLIGETDKVDIDLLADIVYLFRFDDSVVKFIMDRVDKLSSCSGPRDKEIILRRMEGDILRVVGEKVKITREYVRQLENGMMEELSKGTFLDDLREFCLEKAKGIYVEGRIETAPGVYIYSMRNGEHAFEVEYEQGERPIFTSEQYDDFLKEKPMLSPAEILSRALLKGQLCLRIRSIRRDLRLKIHEVALTTGLSYSRVQAIETNERKYLKTLKKSKALSMIIDFYASKLGMESDKLFDMLVSGIIQPVQPGALSKSILDLSTAGSENVQDIDDYDPNKDTLGGQNTQDRKRLRREALQAAAQNPLLKLTDSRLIELMKRAEEIEAVGEELDKRMQEVEEKFNIGAHAATPSAQTGHQELVVKSQDAKDVSIDILINSIHTLVRPQGTQASLIPQGTKILLSDSLFDEADKEHLADLLGKDSPIQILPPKEIRNASINNKTTRNNLACVVSKEDYDNPDLWNHNHKDQNKAVLLILNEDLKRERYLYLEGVIGLANAIIRDDRNAISNYMKLIFTKVVDIDDSKLLELLINSPREFADMIKFKPIMPIDKEELLNQYKSTVENYLVMA